jgi:hypothetical protein
MLDQLVKAFERGSDDLQKVKDAARQAMNGVLDQYEAAALPELQRCEPADEKPPPRWSMLCTGPDDERSIA